MVYHGGSRDSVGCGGAADPGADDILTRSEDVNNGTEVREGGTGVSDGGCSDGDGRRGAGRGSGASVSVRVTSSDLQELVRLVQTQSRAGDILRRGLHPK